MDPLPDEKRVFRLEEIATFWDETNIRVSTAMCCVNAIVQEWTQSSSTGANLFYPEALGMQKAGQQMDRANHCLFFGSECGAALEWVSNCVLAVGSA